MGTYNEVFARSEKKYLIAPEQYARFFTMVEEHLTPAEYGEGSIRSLYYDSPENLLINRSLEKPLYKEKIRLRAYEVPRVDSPVFIEIKKKFKGTVYKRRICVSYAAACAIMNKMNYLKAIDRYPLADPELQAVCTETKAFQIAGEISYLVNHYDNLHPAMLITVSRTSWNSIDDDIRITYDSEITWQNVRPSLISENLGTKLFDNGERVLEIKCGNAYPFWLVDALNACDIRPRSLSKYGRAYQAAHQQALMPERERVLEPLGEPLASPFFPSTVQHARTANREPVGAARVAQQPAHAKHAAMKEEAYCA